MGSRRLAFGFYLFFHLVIAAVIERRPGLAEYEDAAQPSDIFQAPKVRGAAGGAAADPTTTSLAVLPVAAPSTLFAPTTSVFTTTTDIVFSINGKLTSLQSTFVSTSTGLVPIATTTVQSTIVSTSIGLVPVATSQNPISPVPLSLSSKSSTSEIPAIVGGTLGAAITVICGILLCVYFRKRRRAPTAQRPNSANEIRKPSDSESVVINPNRESWAPYINRLQAREAGLTPSNTVSTRQLYISNQVNRARENVAELEKMSTLLRSASNSSRENGTTQDVGADHAIPRAAASLHDEPVNVSSDPLEVRAQLERAIRHIEVMNGRIRDLEMQRRSSWALGLSDEPPPGYSE